jgi:uncharacterized membrane protein
VYGAVLVYVGIRRRRAHARMLGLAGLAMAILNVVLVQICCRYQSVHAALLNSRFVGSGLVAVGIAWCAFLFRTAPDDLESPLKGGGQVEKESLIAPLLIIANALMILLLTLEANDYFTTGARMAFLPEWIDTSDAKQMCFSMIWTIYSIGILLGGFLWSVRALRLMALLLLAVTIGKVFLFDLSFLQGLYRVASFLVLGCILVGVSFLYHRFKDYLIG